MLPRLHRLIVIYHHKREDWWDGTMAICDTVGEVIVKPHLVHHQNCFVWGINPRNTIVAAFDFQIMYKGDGPTMLGGLTYDRKKEVWAGMMNDDIMLLTAQRNAERDTMPLAMKDHPLIVEMFKNRGLRFNLVKRKPEDYSLPWDNPAFVRCVEECGLSRAQLERDLLTAPVAANATPVPEAPPAPPPDQPPPSEA